MKSSEVSLEELKSNIILESRALRLDSHFANTIANNIAAQVEKWLANHPVITKAELDRLITRELKKYNSDLAFIYHNRDKII